MNHHTDRRQELFMHFEECVKRHFAFLDDMSCSIDKSSMGWSVNYASDKIEISIYYERISYEIYLTISLMGNVSCTMDEIISSAQDRQYLYGTDENLVENSVAELSILLMQYGQAYLNVEKEAFNDIVELRKNLSKKYELEIVEEKASVAWKNRNYAEVIALYDTITKDLTQIQQKRLNICKSCNASPDNPRKTTSTL